MGSDKAVVVVDSEEETQLGGERPNVATNPGGGPYLLIQIARLM